MTQSAKDVQGLPWIEGRGAPRRWHACGPSPGPIDLKMFSRLTDILAYMCYSDKATQAWCCHGCVTRTKQHRPVIVPNDNTTHVPTAGSSAALTKPNHTPTPPRKRQRNPTNGHTPHRMKPAHTRLTYTRMRPHAPSHQAGDHPVAAHSERHNPSKVWTLRQSGLPPRAVRSQGQRHRCRSSREQSVWGSQAGGRGL